MSLLTLATVKQFLQISHSAEDVALQILLDSVEEFVSDYTSVRLAADVSGEIEEQVDGGDKNLRPLWHPINSVVSVADRDDGVAVTATLYRSNEWSIWYIDKSRWADEKEGWTVTYTAGYDASTLPAKLKHCIFDLLYRAYQNRGGKKSQSAAGYNVNWDTLLESDIEARLKGAGFRRSIW